ncbi:MAG: hypothetical protein AB7N24_12060 [Dehalococcoidia bacterium]
MISSLKFSLNPVLAGEWESFAAVPVEELRTEGLSYSTEWYLRSTFSIDWNGSRLLDPMNGLWEIGLVAVPLNLTPVMNHCVRGEVQPWDIGIGGPRLWFWPSGDRVEISLVERGEVRPTTTEITTTIDELIDAVTDICRDCVELVERNLPTRHAALVLEWWRNGSVPGT